MTGASALGPWPGTRVLDAQTLAMEVLGDTLAGVVGLPPLVQLPARGPGAGSIGHAATLLEQLPVELGTHGWKLADHPGRDLERARALDREAIDTLAVAAHGWTGPLVVSVRGPWSVATRLYLARGDVVLSDPGAVRDLAAALGEGLAAHLAAVRTAVPGAEPVLVLREPGLPDVLAGAVPTFSGAGRLPAIEREVATATLAQVVAAARAGGAARVVAHGGARVARRALKTLAGAGADAIGIPARAIGGHRVELIAELVERGTGLWLGLPRLRPGATDVRPVVKAIAEPWRAVGLPAAALADVVVHLDTSAGVAGSDAPVVDGRDQRKGLRATVAVAAALAEIAAG